MLTDWVRNDRINEKMNQINQNYELRWYGHIRRMGNDRRFGYGSNASSLPRISWKAEIKRVM